MTSAPDIIDLRTDGGTRPSPGMRAAMAAAEVGDDQFGEDGPTNLLEERVADLLGKEKALWLPSGTMANQVALRVLTRPGDDVIATRECHAVWHESGGSAMNAGVQFSEIGGDGVFTAEEFAAAIKPRGHVVYPPTTLVEIENTHNRAGGVVFPQDEAIRICALADERGIATFLDGSRLWHASAHCGRPLAELAAPFQVVALCLSKGLGCPAGTMLAGSVDHMASAKRQRRIFGGALRQTGFYAAAGLFALDHNVDRIGEDHENALAFAREIAASRHVTIDLARLHTNMIVFRLRDGAAETIAARAREAGILVWAFDAKTIRAVTHHDVTRDQCIRAGRLLAGIIDAR